jgi:hypothetical protein
MTGRKKTEWAWAAGILDGEGSIRVQQRLFNGHANFTLRVCVAMTHQPTIDKLFEITGGGYRTSRHAGSGRPLYVIEWAARKAEKVLRAMSPYLVTKREQAAAAIKFRKLIGTRGRFGRAPMPTDLRETMKQSANSVNLLSMRRTTPSQAAEAVHEA